MHPRLAEGGAGPWRGLPRLSAGPVWPVWATLGIPCPAPTTAVPNTPALDELERREGGTDSSNRAEG